MNSPVPSHGRRISKGVRASRLELVSTRPDASQPLSDADQVGIFQQLVDGLPEQAALVDAETGTILLVNDAWRQSVISNGYSNMGPGNNYFDEVAVLAEAGNVPARLFLPALKEIRQGRRTSFRVVYDGIRRQAGQKFEARLAVMKVGQRQYVRITRYDVTEISQLRSMRDGFSSSLIQAQEAERRRLGRELHDSGLQLLASLGLSLARLKNLRSEAELASVTNDMEGLLLEVQREFRSITFLAHPPQVERLGLAEALRVLVEGYGERAGVEARFDATGAIEDLSADIEHTVFRVAQEAISNVHRHAQSGELAVSLIVRERALHMRVADHGCGIPADLHYGVGLLGMRARLQEVGGRLAIRNASPGTAILASVPLTKA
jgi:two-component system NarL family sensor kinase